MKIAFEDKSYIEITKSSTPNKMFITVAAKNRDNNNQLIVNSVELTAEEFLALFKSVS